MTKCTKNTRMGKGRMENRKERGKQDEEETNKEDEDACN